MLVLYETPAGYALFQIKDESKIQEVEDITQHFSDADSANKLYDYLFISICASFPPLARRSGLHFTAGDECAFPTRVKLKAFGKFSDTSEALVAATSMLESSMTKPLKKFLTKNIVEKKIRFLS